MPNKLHIGYFVDGKWGHNALHRLHEDESIVIDFICVRNDYKDPVLMQLGQENGIDVLHTPNINSDEFLEQLKVYKFDLFVLIRFLEKRFEIFRHFQ